MRRGLDAETFDVALTLMDVEAGYCRPSKWERPLRHGERLGANSQAVRNYARNPVNGKFVKEQ